MTDAQDQDAGVIRAIENHMRLIGMTAYERPKFWPGPRRLRVPRQELQHVDQAVVLTLRLLYAERLHAIDSDVLEVLCGLSAEPIGHACPFRRA